MGRRLPLESHLLVERGAVLGDCSELDTECGHGRVDTSRAGKGIRSEVIDPGGVPSDCARDSCSTFTYDAFIDSAGI